MRSDSTPNPQESLASADADTVAQDITAKLAKAGVKFTVYDLGKIPVNSGAGRPGECQCIACAIQRAVRRVLTSRN